MVDSTPTSSKTHSSEQRRRFFELVGMLAISALLIALSRLEHRLFTLSESLAKNAEFFTTVVYFGLINLNVVFILILSFLIFRNIARLVIERRRGVLGSRLRTKLIVTLVFFALAPTVVMFYISSQFITASFDTWFSAKVRDTMQQTREAGAQVYKQDQRRLESLARAALQRIKVKEPRDGKGLPVIETRGLRGFDSDFGLQVIRVVAVNGEELWSASSKKYSSTHSVILTPALKFAIDRFLAEPALLSTGAVEADDKSDTVKGFAPIIHVSSGTLLGVVITEEHFETQILRSIETILEEFASLRPGAQLIRISYTVILVLMVLVIAFATTWLGFYVARAIVSPIQSLSEGMLEVANGNYNVTLPKKTDDETGALILAFEKMITDLREHEARNQLSTRKLEQSNDELKRRHQYMEVLLRNITAGVISIDARGVITSFNSAAERLLDLSATKCLGSGVSDALGQDLASVFWEPVKEKVARSETFNDQLSLESIGRNLTLIVTGIHIYDEYGNDLGVVLVFDDATEQVRAQRVAAWREVARRIAHEIKNPITPIKLSAERLLRRYEKQFTGEDREIFSSCIGTILNQVDSLRDLVNEFSKFSRMPSIRVKSADVASCLREVAQFFSVSYPDIKFDTSEIAGHIPAILLDTEQFGRALMNIVANAVAALESQPEQEVRFRAKVVDSLNAVRIEISDSGVGIPARDKDKVFEPYYSTKREGTGLGLAIVNQIVSDHGGYIRIVDNEPRGTRVIIDLPMGEASALNPKDS